MKSTLFAWIGNKDLESAENDGADGLGAICQAVIDRKFDELVLLSDYPKKTTTPYINWLSKRDVKNIKLHSADLNKNPTNYRAIYQNAKKAVQNYLDTQTEKAELTFHLSPGTPQMATTWIILANSIFTANLLQSSPERGVENIDLPFDITADYLPELLKKNERKISSLFDHDTSPAGFEEIIHKSPIMKDLVARARLVAPHPVPVLIQGESGTGKEMLAKAIHSASLRKGKPVAINCGAIPEELFESELFGHKKGSFSGAIADKAGYIEEAKGGTLFLDEIGEMPLRIQVKLLRFLQEGTFNRVGDPIERTADVRIVSATNRDLLNEIDLGTFREDLFHRLAVAVLNIPPLRDRDTDIDLLIDRLLDKTNEELNKSGEFKNKMLSNAAKALLKKHSWPGNIRELKNTLTRASIWSTGETIDKEAISGAIMMTLKSKEEKILDRPLDDQFALENVINEVAEHYIHRALQMTAGNKTKAAELLKFKSYQRLDGWIKKYNLS